MDDDFVLFLVWAVGLPLFVVLTGVWVCYNFTREDGGSRPPDEAAAVHRTPPGVRRILLLLDNATYPRRNSLPVSTSGGGGGGGGGRPSTTASTTAAGTAAAAVSEDCAICLGQFEDGERCSVMPICRHEFHRDCIADWLVARNNTCPLCRAKLQWSSQPVAQDRHGIV